MGKLTVVLRWVSIFVLGPILLAQAKDSCLLETAKGGDLVKVRGEAFLGGHDTFIRPVGCEESTADRVILVWGDDRSLAAGKLEVRRDADFFRFHELLQATFPLPPNTFGTGQPRYRVLAYFEGRLEISSAAGFKRDPKTKRITGVEGFGHPVPFTRFRLVATAVSRIEPTEREMRQP
jgi:hypothetical protein